MSKKSIWQKSRRNVFRLSFIALILALFYVVYLDSMVRDEFRKQAWSIPAKVYARPLSFSLGQQLNFDDLLQELALLGYRKKIKAVNQGEFELYGNSLVINTRRFNFWDGIQPQQVLEITVNDEIVTKLKDFSTQKSVGFLRLDPLVLGNIQAGNIEDRRLVTLKQLPEHFIAALMVMEDREFYQHWGISLKGIARAFWSNLSQGAVRQGGSTLTQQLMKNHFLTNERTLSRKIREAIMAMLTEYHYTKDEILQAYVNEVYLGQNNKTGIFGFARASEFYFDKPLSRLNLSQVALLVGMVKGPSFYNPRRNPDKAKKRRNLVLSQMQSRGLISDESYKDASKRSLMVIAKPTRHTSSVPAFMGFIKRELIHEFSLSQLNSEGLRLFTTLDPVVQERAEQALSRRINRLDSVNRKDKKTDTPSELQGAVVISDIKSGDILAMVGDRHPDFVGFNRAVDAYRQTGSVIKPFVYLAALQEADKFNLLTPINDESFTLEGSDGSEWTPRNYDGESHGKVALQEALIKSYNIATARLAIDVGVEKVVGVINEAGFERELPAYPSLALGAKEMSLIEVLRLYQVLANDGVGIQSAGLIAVQDHNNKLLQRYPRATQSLIDKESAFLIKYLLSRVVIRGTAKSIGQGFPDKLYAGKTGTTNDLRDSWYAGFGGERLGVVWIGRDDNQPTHLTGASGALKVWKDIFAKLNEPSIELEMPEDLVWGFELKGFFSSFRNCKNKELIPFYPLQLPDSYQICE